MNLKEILILPELLYLPLCFTSNYSGLRIKWSVVYYFSEDFTLIPKRLTFPVTFIYTWYTVYAQCAYP